MFVLTLVQLFEALRCQRPLSLGQRGQMCQAVVVVPLFLPVVVLSVLPVAVLQQQAAVPVLLVVRAVLLVVLLVVRAVLRAVVLPQGALPAVVHPVVVVLLLRQP